MKQSEFIAAIDLGSSKMIAMVGKKNEQGILSIIASEQEESGTCIRRGCVYNVDDAANKIKNLLTKLNSKVTPQIEKIYIGLGGQSVRTEICKISKDIPNTIINEELIQSLYDECKSRQPEFSEILDIVSPEFFIDGRQEENPIGISCSNIEVHFKLILGRPSLKRTLNSVAEKAGIEIAGYIISPMATASAILSDTEKELGCALIEFGAGVTYVSIYKSKLLKYLVTIPLGSHAITKDLCDLNILEKEAEELKVNFGSAIIELDNNSRAKTAKLAEGLYGTREIELNKLDNIIESRMDEILANVIEQINLSGLGQSLGSGIIITGGAASIKNMTESVKNKSGYQVRLGAAKKTLVNQAAELSQQYGNAQIIGLLSLGKENCAQEVIEPPVTVSETLFADDEIEVVQPERPAKGTNTKKDKNNGGLFGKLSRKFDGFSKSLFEEEE